MQIDDKFNPHLTNILQPSKDNVFSLLGKSLADYNKNKKIDEITSFEKKMKTQENDRAEKVANANIGNMKFGQELSVKQFDLNKESNLFNRGIKNKEINIREKTANANIGFNNKVLTQRESKIKILREKYKRESVPANNLNDFKTLNSKIKKIKKATTERTVIQKGMKDGKIILKYSDGSVEYGD